MAAFASAYQLGYHYLETDVVNTRDGQVITSHGAITWPGSLLRGTFTYRRLRTLSHSQILDQLRVDGETVPLLGDVLKAFPNSKFLIDPKVDSVVEPLLEVIKRCKAQNRVLIQSFSEPRIERIALLSDDLKLGLLIGRNIALLKKLYRLRRSRLKHLESVAIHHWIINKRMADQVHRQNVKVLVWTANSHRAIKKAINCQVDGIISDRIKLLQETIKLID
jgi:glycerophosphoryl diester phosphodiesterase